MNLRRITKVTMNTGFLDIGGLGVNSNLSVNDFMHGLDHALVATRPFKSAERLVFIGDRDGDYTLNGRHHTEGWICNDVAHRVLGAGRKTKKFTLWVKKVPL